MYTNNHLQYLLTNYHDDLDFSLNSCGIDVLNKNWDNKIINQNAYKSAGILIEIASRQIECRDTFFADHHSWLPQGVHNDGHDGDDLFGF